MSQQSYGNGQLDRNEMFALGAAAGAVITAAVTEYLERRRPKTAWEKAQARGTEALDAISGTAQIGRKRARRYVNAAGDYVQDALDTTAATLSGSTKRKSAKGGKQASGLKKVAAAALGTAAAPSVVERVRDYASSAAERVVGDPYAVSGSIRETLKEQLDQVRGASGDGGLAEMARSAGGSAVESLRSIATTAGDSVAGYTTAVRETIRDAELGGKARGYGEAVTDAVAGYAATAADTLKDAKLGERAKDVSAVVSERVKDYTATAAETLKDAKLGERVKDYTTTAAETLKDAKLGERAKDYATVAGVTMAAYSSEASRAARQGATKLSESASHLAETTSEQVGEVRKGVRTSVKRTRRRVNWGLRSFLIGLVVGLLTAPQSGENTRDALTSFVENLLEVFLPEQRPNQSSF